MQPGKRHEQANATIGRKTPPPSFAERAVSAALRLWRPAGSVLAVGLALLLTMHVVNGKHGLSVWQQKRVEDKQLRQEIDSLEQENARLRHRVEKLKSDPHAIEREAREKLHYAKPGEVIYSLPPDPPAPTQPSGK
ncbi:MAG TPA: septum formation initiator family protein [Terracidiphilus sp.]|jgi:cell division protein FtsB